MEVLDRPLDEVPIHDRTEEEQYAFYTDLLKEAQKEFAGRTEPKETLAQMLGEFTALEGYPGIFQRDMCLETEIRAIEVYELTDTTSPSGMVRAAAALASLVLYRLKLPENEEEARAKVLGYARGTVDEDEIFHPLTEREVGRLFKNSDQLNEVLERSGFNLKGDKKDDDPNP